MDWVNEQLSQDGLPTKTLETYDDDEYGFDSRLKTYLKPRDGLKSIVGPFLKKSCRVGQRTKTTGQKI